MNTRFALRIVFASFVLLLLILSCESDKPTAPSEPIARSWHYQESPFQYNSIWGSSSTNVVAVGDGGVIMHYDGMRWEGKASGTSEELYGVWGSSSKDVFAVGDRGTILHYDGSSWNTMMGNTDNSLLGVWGTSRTDVFAVGRGVILHYDGTNWSVQSPDTLSCTFLGIWGTSSTQVLAVGCDTAYNGVIFRYNGVHWTPEPIGAQEVLLSIWGVSASDAYVSGANGVLHFDGSTWDTLPGAPHWSYSIWGASSTDLFCVGFDNRECYVLRYDGVS